MSEGMRKLIIMAVFTLVLTGALIGCFSGAKCDVLPKSILKNIKNYNSYNQISVKKSVEKENCCNGVSVHIDDDLEKSIQSASVGGASKIVMEQSSRRVLYDVDGNVRRYPASTTKILTALCVLENCTLSDIVEVPKEAEGVEGSSLYLRCGDKISVEDLLYGLMLRSGNDCAVALAIKTSGSVDNFVEIMNEKALEIGAENSHFVNPHGLHDDNHYVTAYDLALICAKAYEGEDFCRIVSTKKRKIVVNGEDRYIANKNKMLSSYSGANGVKTGYTKRSGRCLVSGAKRDGMQLISVVLNCPDMWIDTVRMLDFAFDNYVMQPLDNALLSCGDKEINVVFPQNATTDWCDIYYPVRRDGSEKLIIKSA